MPIILLIEIRRFISHRWTLSKKGFIRLLGGCAVIILVMGKLTSSFYELLQWLPLGLFPLILAQIYTPNISQILRDFVANPYFEKQGFQWKRTPINLFYPYFALCLLSASATNANGLVFYGLAWALVSVFFLSLRPVRSNRMSCLVLMVLAGVLGHWFHNQLSQLQFDLTWFNNGRGQGGEPLQALKEESPLELILRRLIEELTAPFKEQLPPDPNTRGLWYLLLIIFVVGIVVGLLFWWRRRQKLREISSRGELLGMRSQKTIPGLDSEFYQIEQAFIDLKLERQSSETLQQWMARLATQLSTAQVDSLNPILELHYRYRFDPQGINPAERDQLKVLSRSWLAQLNATQSHPDRQEKAT